MIPRFFHRSCGFWTAARTGAIIKRKKKILSDKIKKPNCTERPGMAGPAAILLFAFVLGGGIGLMDSASDGVAALALAGPVESHDDNAKRNRKPVRPDSSPGKAKENVESSPAVPEKRRKYRRCRLGDFACYDDTAERLAASNRFPALKSG